MYRRNVFTLMTLGIICLISLIGVQYMWYNRTWKLKNNEIDRLTHIALRETAQDLSQIYAHALNETELIRRLSSNYYVVNINSQINASELEFYLSKNFEQYALNTDYEYAIFDCETNKMLYGAYIQHREIGNKENEVTQKELPTYDEFIYYFGVQFPNRKSFVFAQLKTQLATAFISLLIMGFIIYSLYIILYQKRFLDLQKDFINSITHEFKTPITSLTLAGNLIRQHPIVQSHDKLSQYGEIILTQSEQLNQHVDNILRLSKIERNELLLQKEDCELLTIIPEIISSFRQRLENTSGEIRFEKDLPQAIVRADKSHLSNVIVNLIDNALKYNDNQPIINLKLSKNNNRLILVIEDNGIGIDDLDLKNIFNKFYRSKSDKTQKRNGFGLGLYYVKSICDLHKWAITVSSKTNAGTAFKIVFS